MADNWRKRLKKLIEEGNGLTMKEVSLRAGLHASTVHNILSKGAVPSVENFCAIADALGVSPQWLLQGDENLTVKIPVIGIVAAGEGWEQQDGARHDPVEFEIGDRDVIAIEVRGNSMAPVYRDRDVLICHRRSGKYVDNSIGLDCAVLSKDGEGFIKILKRGTRPGLYNLKSYNPVFDDIENVALQWAAPIVWIKRGRHS